MVIYEVNLAVDNDVAEAFAVWLRQHIPAMLALDGFERAVWYQRDPEGGRQQWSIHYHLDSWKSLEAYFAEHAEAMRQDGTARFGGRFAADRRVLVARETFAASANTS